MPVIASTGAPSSLRVEQPVEQMDRARAPAVEKQTPSLPVNLA